MENFQNRMRIVIIANNSNGLYLFRRQLINELIEKGNQITVLTPFDTDVDKLTALGAVLVETPINRRGTNPIEDFALQKMYKNELRRIRPDLVITYTIKPNVYGLVPALVVTPPKNVEEGPVMLLNASSPDGVVLRETSI